jgi:hypothetical protein
LLPVNDKGFNEGYAYADAVHDGTVRALSVCLISTERIAVLTVCNTCMQSAFPTNAIPSVELRNHCYFEAIKWVDRYRALTAEVLGPSIPPMLSGSCVFSLDCSGSTRF